MLSKKFLDQIRHDLQPLKKYETVIYGSYAKNAATSRSDIDIAIITRQPDRNEIVWKNNLGKVPEKYDLKIFEILPLEIKISIVKSHQVIWGSPLEISEYFYHFTKLWQDVRCRFIDNKIGSIKEKIKLLKRSANLQF